MGGIENGPIAGLQTVYRICLWNAPPGWNAAGRRGPKIQLTTVGRQRIGTINAVEPVPRRISLLRHRLRAYRHRLPSNRVSTTFVWCHEDIQTILSASLARLLKSWTYEIRGDRVEFDVMDESRLWRLNDLTQRLLNVPSHLPMSGFQAPSRGNQYRLPNWAATAGEPSIAFVAVDCHQR